MKLLDYYLSFVETLRKQLEEDDKRWGDEWKKRPIKAGPSNPLISISLTQAHWAHQNDRIYSRIKEYYDDWETGETETMPWLKIAGLAFIAWVRETHPDTYHE